MKKILLRILDVSIAILLALVFILSCGVNVNAEVPSTQIVQKVNSSWGTYPFTFTMNNEYFTIEDSTGITTSTILNPVFFYTNDNVTFKSISGSKFYATCINLGIGVILNPTRLNSLTDDFWSKIGGVTDNNNKLQGGLYTTNGVFLGYCLNDISGCYWYENNNDDDITIPDYQVDNVYNHFKYNNEQIAPDYFVFYPLSNTYIKSNLNTAFTTEQNENFDSLCQTYNFGYMAKKGSNGKFDLTSRYNFGYSVFENVSYLINYNTTSTYLNLWNDFCSVNVDKNLECLGTEMLNVNETLYIYLKAYDNNDSLITSVTAHNTRGSETATQNFSTAGDIVLQTAPTAMQIPFNFDKITIYKSIDIKNNMDTQNYYPDTYVTDKYQNYQVNSNNEIQTNTTTVDNSTTYNTNSYNDSNDSFYNYYTDNNYDQSQQITNNSTIINNYYGNNDNPDNPDNPDDPDNPSGTLDAILQAILRFFNAIGNIIGTVLAGLLNMIDAVLESIAGITENMTGLTDFFSAMLGWLPEPIPQILGIGISICIICAVVKFIRG